MFNFFLKNFICKKYSKEAYTDELTGLRNRRDFNLEIELFFEFLKKRKKYNTDN